MIDKSKESFEPNRYLISYNEEVDTFNILFGEYNEETKETKIESNIVISSDNMQKFYASLTFKAMLYELETKNKFFENQPKYLEMEFEKLKSRLKIEEVD